jgi:hypothetical protein
MQKIIKQGLPSFAKLDNKQILTNDCIETAISFDSIDERNSLVNL